MQNYKNHARMHPLYHYVLSLLVLGTFVTTIVNLVFAIQDETSLLQPILFVLFAVIALILMMLVRTYALQAQDRAIRAEEQFRYYALTGKRLDATLSIKQIVALRFASDEEFPALVEKAAQMKPDEIKRAIQNWKADENRI